jgi:glycosyltransferase involved in cell wall biosynthesis
MRRILFFHQGRMSDISGSVYRGLCKQFPDKEVIAIDINEQLKKRQWIIAVNLLIAFIVYGWDMICAKRDLDESFFGTKYIFKMIKRIAIQIHKQYPSDFSFQIWSMFDYSSPEIPHFVYTDHTYKSCRDYPDYGKEKWAPVRRAWIIALEESIYDNSSCIFTRSNNVTEALINKYDIPNDKVFCVGVGTNVPLEKLCKIPIALDRYKRKRIIVVGWAWERKGVPELVEAFKKVLKVHNDAKLIVVGSTSTIEEKSVEVVGSVPLDKVLEYLAQSSVYCMPTKMEPFGIVFIEALAAGLPVVALRLGAAPDFVISGQTGELVEYGDIEGLSKALINLLDDPEKCRQYGENGRKLVQEKYNWDIVFQKIKDKINEIIITK